MQTGLKSASSATAMSFDGSSTSAFVLQPTNGTAPRAAYLSPAPPPGPLSHRYTLLLVEDNGGNLGAAGVSRRGFDIAGALDGAGLTDKVVVGNYFTVGGLKGAASGNGTGTERGAPTGTGGVSPPSSTTGGSPAATSALVARAGRTTPEMNVVCVVCMLVGGIGLGWYL